MSDALDSRLFGTWQADPNDLETGRLYGRASMTFRPDGTLTYLAPELGKTDARILMVYRTEHGFLITDQPSHPREDKSKYRVGDDGLLYLTKAGTTSRFVRVSTEHPISEEEKHTRKAIATQPSRPDEQLSKVWGTGVSLKEFRSPTRFRFWYPACWSQAFHEDGAPYVKGPADRSGILRIGTLIVEPKPRRFFGRKHLPDTNERLATLQAKSPDSRFVRLGERLTVYSIKGDPPFTHHQWYFGDGNVVIVATYSEDAEFSVTLEGRAEFEAVSWIIQTFNFE